MRMITTAAAAAFAVTLSTAGFVPFAAHAATACPQTASQEGGAAAHGTPTPQFAATGDANGAPGNMSSQPKAQFAAGGQGSGATGGAATQNPPAAQFAAGGQGSGATGGAATQDPPAAQFAAANCP